MTGLMLVSGLAGAPGLTTDIAMVQGATLALFFAFSANARNVIFADASGSTSHLLLRTRILLLLPLAAATFILSSVLGAVDGWLAFVLICRRSTEWVGEVFLSSCEVQDARQPAVMTIFAECTTFVLAVALIFSADTDPYLALIPWALAPLVVAIKGRLVKEDTPASLMDNVARLAPNMGSTTIIGIGVYVFRLSIVMLVGRIAAGDLFTAFVIGGLVPTVYNSSIGPSLALRKDRNGARDPALKLMIWLVPVLFFSGLSITTFCLVYPDLSNIFRKSHQFWTAVGLSISGGAIMMIALHRRIIMLQRRMNVEIFGSDVLSNILIVVSVPYFYYLLGVRSLEGLYVFSAVLTLCFYWSAERRSTPAEAKRYDTTKLIAIGALVLIPVFFQLTGHIFRDSSFVFDTGRTLKQLPIPLSAIAIVVGVLLLGKFRGTHRSLTVFFFTAVLLVLATLAVREPDARGPRLILMAQYLLPFFGLVLGEMYGSASNNGEFEKTCLAVISIVVPLQLLCSWLQGLTILTPYLYLLSIYQHILYVPVIVVIAYGMAFMCLWESGMKFRVALCALSPLIGIYAGASYSVEVFIILVGIVAVGVLWRHHRLPAPRLAASILAVVILTGLSYCYMTRMIPVDTMPARVSAMLDESETKYGLAATASSPHNLTERLKHWSFYGKEICSSFREFSVGHSYPPNRQSHPSAYNYYLDVLYNFGFLSLTPLLVLLVYTGWLVYRSGVALRKDRFLLAALVAVFVVFVIDNSLKVGLRQPYPGIFGFILLGLAQARLSGLTGRLH